MYADRLQSQEELAFHVSTFIEKRASVSAADFLKLTKTVSSTIFLCVTK